MTLSFFLLVMMLNLGQISWVFYIEHKTRKLWEREHRARMSLYDDHLEHIRCQALLFEKNRLQFERQLAEGIEALPRATKVN